MKTLILQTTLFFSFVFVINNSHAQDFVCGNDDHVPDTSSAKASSCARASSTYINKYRTPSFFTPNKSNISLKTILINIFIFRDASGNGLLNDTPSVRASLQEIIDSVNHRQANVKTRGYDLECPVPTDYISDSKIRFEINHIGFVNNSTLYNDTSNFSTYNQYIRNNYPSLDNAMNFIVVNRFPPAAGAYYHSQTDGFIVTDQFRPDGGDPDELFTSSYVYGHVNHELGHSLDLLHLYDSAVKDTSNFDFLDDVFGTCPDPCESDSTKPCFIPPSDLTPCNPSPGEICWFQCPDCWTDRKSGHGATPLMSGRAEESFYISPKQAGQMHRSLMVIEPEFSFKTSGHNFVKEKYPAANDYIISSNETWDFKLKMYQNIVIEPSVTLTIKCEVLMPISGKIIVKPGGRLVIDGGKITKAHDEMWKGIEVWGNSNLSQFLGNQGEVVLKQGAIIEHAQEGIMNCKHGDAYSTGGIIKAYNSTFRNCKRSVAFYKYENYHNGLLYNDKSIFEDCEFIIDDDFTLAQPIGMASLWNTYGVKFLSSDFIDERTDISTPYGIKTIDAYTIVSGQCNTPIIGGCSSVDFGTFENFKIAIDAMDATTNNTIRIDRNQFINNEFGVKISAIDEAEVIRNEFSWNANIVSGNTDNHGLYLLNASSFQVEENSFIDNQTLHSGSATGILTDNSGTDNNEIYKNYFEGLYVGNWAVNNNRSISPTGLDGLQFLCNEYDNSNLSSGGNTQLITSSNSNSNINGVRKDFGGLNKSSGNCHALQAISYEDIYNSTSFPLTYYYYNSALPCKEPIEYNSDVIAISISDSNTCESNFTTYPPVVIGGVLTPVRISGLTADFESNNTSFLSLNDSLDVLIDHNNTDSLLTAINGLESGTNTDILYGDLNTISPYLSDTVLKRIAYYHPAYFSESMVVDIIVDNIDAIKSKDFIDYLKNKDTPFSGANIDTIESKIGRYLTDRGDIELDIMDYGSQKSFASHYLLRNIQHDSIHNNFDTLRNWYQLNNDELKDFNIVDVYLREGDYAAANDYLDSMAVTDYPDVLQGQIDYFITLKEAVITLFQDTLTLADLDSVQVATLKVFAENASGRAKYQAQNILCFFYDYCILDIPSVPVLPKKQLVQNDEIIDAKEDNLHPVKIYPIPANEQLIIEWLSDGDADYQMEVKDIQGRSIYNNKVTTNRFTWNTTNLSEGIYVIYIHDDNQISYSKKITIVH